MGTDCKDLSCNLDSILFHLFPSQVSDRLMLTAKQCPPYVRSMLPIFRPGNYPWKYIFFLKLDSNQRSSISTCPLLRCHPSWGNTLDFLNSLLSSRPPQMKGRPFTELSSTTIITIFTIITSLTKFAQVEVKSFDIRLSGSSKLSFNIVTMSVALMNIIVRIKPTNLELSQTWHIL